jgi:hypothetical protein
MARHFSVGHRNRSGRKEPRSSEIVKDQLLALPISENQCLAAVHPIIDRVQHPNGLEQVKGHAEGITEVRASSELKSNGTLVSSSEYLKGGQWVPGHRATYRQAPGEQVVFR